MAQPPYDQRRYVPVQMNYPQTASPAVGVPPHHHPAAIRYPAPAPAMRDPNGIVDSSLLDLSRRAVQRPPTVQSPPVAMASPVYDQRLHSHAPSHPYTHSDVPARPFRGDPYGSQGSLTPPSPARPLGPLFPEPKPKDILDLHNEAVRRGVPLDWKDEQAGPRWHSTVLLANQPTASAFGKTKKDARHSAARIALPVLRAQPYVSRRG